MRKGRRQRLRGVECLEQRLCLSATHGWDGPGQGQVQLGYTIGDAPDHLDAAWVAETLEAALRVWSDVADIQFVEAPRAGMRDAIDFRFTPIDGPGGALAQAYFPDDANRNPLAGDVEFDVAESWEAGSGSHSGFDLMLVAVHEIGHALGLDHSTTAESVMRASVSGRESFQGLSPHDVDQILQLYAAAEHAPEHDVHHDGAIAPGIAGSLTPANPRENPRESRPEAPSADPSGVAPPRRIDPPVGVPEESARDEGEGSSRVGDDSAAPDETDTRPGERTRYREPNRRDWETRLRRWWRFANLPLAPFADPASGRESDEGQSPAPLDHPLDHPFDNPLDNPLDEPWEDLDGPLEPLAGGRADRRTGGANREAGGDGRETGGASGEEGVATAEDRTATDGAREGFGQDDNGECSRRLGRLGRGEPSAGALGRVDRPVLARRGTWPMPGSGRLLVIRVFVAGWWPRH